MQEALLGIANKKWNSIYAAANALKIPQSTLYDRSQEGAKSRSEAQTDQQCLTPAEECELAKWIRRLMISGTPAQHLIVKEMAETIRNKHVANVNNSSIELVTYPPLGKGWTQRFIRCHPELKSVIGK